MLPVFPVMLHVFCVMLQEFLVMLHVFRVMLHVEQFSDSLEAHAQNHEFENDGYLRHTKRHVGCFV